MHDDWDYYWSIECEQEGSFAQTRLRDCTVEVLDHYAQVTDLSPEFRAAFPRLSELLEQARVTRLTAQDGSVFYLLGWTFEYGDCGALTPAPTDVDADADLHPDHALLLRHFGGFVGWFGDIPDSNYFHDAHEWLFSWADLQAAESPLPDARGYTQFSQEANADCFLYENESGQVWMFFHEGIGESLYEEEEEFGQDLQLQRVDGAPGPRCYQVVSCLFRDWVERGADAWLTCFEELPEDED